MLIVHPTNCKYEAYPVSPSAFQWIEWPLDQLNRQFIRITRDPFYQPTQSIRLISLHAQLAFGHFRLKNYTQAGKNLKSLLIETSGLLNPTVKCSGLIFCGLAITPIVLYLTPVTLAVDLVTGAWEVHQAYKKCYPKEHIDLILKKKWIASTVQHGSFFVINGLFFRIWKINLRHSLSSQIPFNATYIPVFFNVALIVTFFFAARWKSNFNKTADFLAQSMYGLPVYRFSILVTANYLPEWTHPDKFTIFIGGIKHEKDRFYSIWLDGDCRKAEFDLNEEWKNYGENDRKNLVRRTDETPFGGFLNRFKDSVPPYKLLEIPADYTEEELKAAYKKWAMAFHPDRAKDPDAATLFKALTYANELLKKKFQASERF